MASGQTSNEAAAPATPAAAPTPVASTLPIVGPRFAAGGIVPATCRPSAGAPSALRTLLTQLRIRRPGDQSCRHLEGVIGPAQTVGRLLKVKVKIAVPNVPWEVCGTQRDGSRIRQTGFDNERRISMVELRLGCQERERPVGINDQKFLLEFDDEVLVTEAEGRPIDGAEHHTGAQGRAASEKRRIVAVESDLASVSAPTKFRCRM